MVNKRQNSLELYLCEKPSQGRDIARILDARQRHEGYMQGNNLIVTWCIGHLLEMIPPDAYDPRYKRWSLADLPILPQQWRLEAKKTTKKQLTVIKNLLKRCQRVVIATDADREGETIAREVLDYFNFTGATQRLWLSALDPISIKRALQDIRQSKETEPLYYSGLARGRADWLIGMNLTRAYTLLANDRQVRSVGRVQTPTLALIAKRDREILNFVAEPYYEVMAFFATQDGFLEAQWQISKPATESMKKSSQSQADRNSSYKKNLCLDQQQAQAVIDRCQQQLGTVTTASTIRKKQAPPLLYNLSGLQQEASRRWGYGAQEVLNVAQSLYETHKLTSYPRSDCEYLPLSQFKDAAKILQNLCKNDPTLCELIANANQSQKSRVWNDKKITAHHAIIPTQATPGVQALNHKEKNIYDLIRRRYIAQFFPDFEYDQSIIIINIKADQFKASGRISRIQGWKQVLSHSSKAVKKVSQATPQDTREADKELPSVTKNEQLLCDHLKLHNKLTRPPKHFTEGTLIKAMETIGTQITDKVMKKILRETAGLGTQATRANIIQTLFQRKYIYKDKKTVQVTTLGFELIDAVPDTIKDPILTAQWEQQLDDIAQNKAQSIEGFLQQQINLLEGIINQIKHPHNNNSVNTSGISHQHKVGSPCPQCQHPLEIRQAIRGKKVGMDYLGCSHFPDCRFYEWL